MSRNLDELARMFAREDQITFAVGQVISTNPYRIKYGDKIILEERKLRFNSGLINGYEGTYNGQTFRVYDHLSVGDQVMMIPQGETWYVLSKVVKA